MKSIIILSLEDEKALEPVVSALSDIAEVRILTPRVVKIFGGLKIQPTPRVIRALLSISNLLVVFERNICSAAPSKREADFLKDVKNLANKLKVKTVTKDLSAFVFQGKCAEISPTEFAVIAAHLCSVSISAVEDIKNKTGLSPLFISIFPHTDTDYLRRLGRKFTSRVAFIHTPNELCRELKNSSFSVCYETTCAYASVLARTTCFLDVKTKSARELIAKITEINGMQNILLPYTKNRESLIEKVGASNSDFNLIINSIRDTIKGDIAGAIIH